MAEGTRRATGAALRTAAVALQRSHSALGANFRRTARRKGYRKAVFATARKLAQLVYRMLRWGQDYVDIGERAYELRFRQERIAGMQRAADALGYELVPQAQPSTWPRTLGPLAVRRGCEDDVSGQVSGTMTRVPKTLGAGAAVAFAVLLALVDGASANSRGGIVVLGNVDRFPTQSCTLCHTGTPSDGPSTTVEVLVDGSSASLYTYTPGETVSLVVNFMDSRANRMGFVVMARSDDPAEAESGNYCGTGGTMAVADTTAGEGVKVRNGEFIRRKPDRCGDRLNDIWWATHTLAKNGSSASWEVSWTLPSESVGPITLLFVGNAGNGDRSSSNDNIVTRQFTVRPVGSAAPQPAPVISGTGHGFGAVSGGTPKAAQGAIASLTGTDFVATAMASGSTLDDSGNLSKLVNGVCVEIGTLRAPLLAVSSERVTFQIPVDAGLGDSTLKVVRDCGTSDSTASEAMAFQVVAARPVFLQFSEDSSGITAVRPNMALVASVGSVEGRRTRPAVPGDILTVFGTGLGQTDPPYSDGEIASAVRELSASDLRVMIGELEIDAANVHYAGAAPYFAGLQQLMVQVPDQTAAGSHQFSVLVGGVSSVTGPMLEVATAESLLPALSCTAGMMLASLGRCQATFGDNTGILEVDADRNACVLGSIVNDTEGWICGAESLDLTPYGAAITKNDDGTWTISSLPATTTGQP